MATEIDNASEFVTDPGRTAYLVETLRQADTARSKNRRLITELFSGDRPYSEEEADELGINTNTNWLLATEMFHRALLRFTNVFVNPRRLVSFAPVINHPKAFSWARTLTAEFNRTLRKRKDFRAFQRDKWASAVLHGLGPMVWPEQLDWCPRFTALDEIKFPSRCYASLDNCHMFAVLRRYTAADVYQRILNNPAADEGWNKPAVKEALRSRLLSGLQQWGASIVYDVYSPETLDQDLRTDAGIYASDVVPTLDVWFLFYRWKDEGWKAKAVELTFSGGVPSKFLYESKKPITGDIHDLVHLQVADGSPMVPKRIHSIRGLGYMIYRPAQEANRVICRYFDLLFENSMQWFRSQTVDNTERVQELMLHNLAVLPNGIAPIPPNERFVGDAQGLMQGTSFARQLIQEPTMSYLAQPNLPETGGKMTATETSARVNEAQAMLRGMVVEGYAGQMDLMEIVFKRLTNPAVVDAQPSAQEFFARCTQAGVPPQAITPDAFEPTVERMLGAGDRMMSMVEADALMASRHLYDPVAQREILRLRTLAVTDDPALTERLVPDQPEPSPAIESTQNVFGLLLQGVAAQPPRNVDPAEYIQMLLQLTMQRIQQLSDNPLIIQSEVDGLFTVLEHMSQHVGALPEDQGMRKQVAGQLEKLNQATQLLAQRVQEDMQRREDMDAAAGRQGGNGGLEQAKIAETDARTERTQVESEAKLGEMLRADEAKTDPVSDARAARVHQEIAQQDELQVPRVAEAYAKADRARALAEDARKPEPKTAKTR